jgi:hypothetical protein
MGYDYAIHSDFLVHWTGKDIDNGLDPDWERPHNKADHSRTTPAATKRYVKRLRDILKHGLWMTEEPDCSYSGIEVPSTPKCCFTELKVSESRKHARQYGRLGVGVKRPFMFRRHGRPLTYFGFNSTSDDRLLNACARDLIDKKLLNFFKPMNSSTDLNYDLYGESEWRLIFFNSLLLDGRMVDPRDPRNVDANLYFKSLLPAEQDKLKYLIPLDGWLGLIIYPSLDVKNAAQQGSDPSIKSEVERIKSDPRDHANRVEQGNWPIETDLDACRNF